MGNQILISVVSPVYRAENTISKLVGEVEKNLGSFTQNYEIILVNDQSPDNSWFEIMKECKRNPRVKGINLSRNFGQHYAITAGLHFSEGQWIVVMDCDLQDRPEEIPALYAKAIEGWDSVLAQRLIRQDGFFKKIFSKFFYYLFSKLTDDNHDHTIANFGIYNRKVIDAVLEMGDQIRFFPTMVKWVGFSKYYLPVKHAEREEGKTSYNFNKLVNLAIDAIISFSDKPLRLTIKFGFLSIFISLLVMFFYFMLYITGRIKVAGYTSLILSFWFLSSVVIFILGIIGLYIGKIFDKVKDRPGFIISEKINL